MSEPTTDGTVLLAIGRLEGKMDMVLVAHRDHASRLDTADARLDAVDKRLAKLEGKLVVASAVVTAVATAIVWILEHFDILSSSGGGP